MTAEAPRFTKLTSRVVPLPITDVDTDQIIPARFLKTTDKNGLGVSLFCDWRYDAAGAPKPEFALNRPENQGAQILLAGDNFGCGSSREHAPWALVGWGLRAVVSTRFADIFKGNALKNGLLPVTVEPDFAAKLFAARAADPGLLVTVDLAEKTIAFGPAGETRATFPVDPFARKCLLEGLDELGYLLSLGKQVEAYEAARR